MVIERLILEFQTDDALNHVGQHREHPCVVTFNTLQEFVDAVITEESPCAVVQVDLSRFTTVNLPSLVPSSITADCSTGTPGDEKPSTPERIRQSQNGLRSGSSRRQRIGEQLQSQARHVAASDRVDSIDQLLEMLSFREWEVLILMLKGRTSKEMGSELHIGLPTVGKHRTRVLQTFGVRDHIELFQLLNSIVS